MNLSPMLASNWPNVRPILPADLSVFIQPKINGIRILATKLRGDVMLFTRSGRIVPGCPHILDALRFYLPEGDTWDGELAVPGGRPTAEEFYAFCGAVQKGLENINLMYYIFDNLSEGIQREGYAKRLASLKSWLWHSPSLCPIHYITTTVEDAEKIAAQLMAAGWEGAIVRLPDAPYEHKRSKSLIKIKEVYDTEEKPL